jgi:hypothetical protein
VAGSWLCKLAFAMDTPRHRSSDWFNVCMLLVSVVSAAVIRDIISCFQQEIPVLHWILVR